MEIRITKAQVGRLDGSDYQKTEGYNIAISFNQTNWQIIGINDGLTMIETRQLLDALKQLRLPPKVRGK